MFVHVNFKMNPKINIFFLLIFSVLSYSQELTVTYFDQFVYPESVTIKNEYYANLLFLNGKSIYYPIEEVKDFKEVKTSGEYETKSINKKVLHKFSTINFINKNDDSQVTVVSQGGKKYLISEKLQLLDWTITDKKKKIGEYNCRLALSKSKGVKIEAWFTEEIPVPAGPAEYGGLPGLIIEVKKGIKHILAKKVVFSTNKELIIPPVDGDVTSRKEYDDIMNAKRGIKESDVSNTEVESFAGGTKTTTTRTVISKREFMEKKEN